MQSVASGMVDIVRDFLTAHQLMRRLFARFRTGDLRFAEVQDLVSDGDDSVLFRLKEHCHALFRSGNGRPGKVAPREALFDLAVGSLFHEAMKFRETLYQLEVYAPKVRELRDQAGPNSDGEATELFREFDRILAASSLRIEETLEETEALLAHTRDQLCVLLSHHRNNGLVFRYLIAHREDVEDVFVGGLDALLHDLQGDVTRGYMLAVDSYLESACFPQALVVLEEASRRGGDAGDVERLGAYARGMQAFLDGDYPLAVQELDRWLGSNPPADESTYGSLALAAASRIPQLATEAQVPGAKRATELAKRIEQRVGAPTPEA